MQHETQESKNGRVRFTGEATSPPPWYRLIQAGDEGTIAGDPSKLFGPTDTVYVRFDDDPAGRVTEIPTADLEAIEPETSPQHITAGEVEPGDTIETHGGYGTIMVRFIQPAIGSDDIRFRGYEVDDDGEPIGNLITVYRYAADEVIRIGSPETEAGSYPGDEPEIWEAGATRNDGSVPDYRETPADQMTREELAVEHEAVNRRILEAMNAGRGADKAREIIRREEVEHAMFSIDHGREAADELIQAGADGSERCINCGAYRSPRLDPDGCTCIGDERADWPERTDDGDTYRVMHRPRQAGVFSYGQPEIIAERDSHEAAERARAEAEAELTGPTWITRVIG